MGPRGFLWQATLVMSMLLPMFAGASQVTASTPAPPTATVTPVPPSVSPTPAPGRQQGYMFETLTADGMREYHLGYLLFLPQGYGDDPQKKWPLILYLHGMGERGDTVEDLERLKGYGVPWRIEERPDLPFIVVSPQCPSGATWFDPFQFVALNAFLDHIMAAYSVDPARLYVTGASMGGAGVWELGMKYPDRFAALAPVAGYAKTDDVCNLKHMPIWVFHGQKDSNVYIQYSQQLVRALKACGNDVRFTIYPDAEHDNSTWKPTYENPELYTWFLQQTR